MANNPRIYLWLLLIFAAWLNYEAWQRDYAPPVTAAANPSSPAAPANDIGAAIPQAAPSENAVAPAPAPGSADSPVPAPSTGTPPQPGPEAQNGAATPTATAVTPVHVRTDVLDVYINPVGGTIQRADLLQYAKRKGEAERVRLMNTEPNTRYLLQTGLTGPDSAERPTHVATFTPENTEYVLPEGAKELRVPLTWTDGKGVTVTKTFVFKPGQYRVDLEQVVENKSDAPWQAAPGAAML